MWYSWRDTWGLNYWPTLAAAGAALILAALMIFIMPELVAYLVATMLLWGGITLVAVAWRSRKAAKDGLQFRTQTWHVW